ncbi:hypothetical protein E1211_17825 [Micromonospora sp. 15K316]|uniref:hypothetical protein n=1 Tax=Micromonospora sp. 15K316 TaxID=2530376 RepID=UPI00104D0920|nr:hypothetical protein [Micromonospora sp. 15K316]TDC34207.1 hypothetical protein E1211_17825 [Micromonospora sp. 15K316]
MPTAADLDRVAQAARFTSVEAVRLHLRRVIERINQQGNRVIGYMDAGRTHDDYTQVVQQISELAGEALTLAAQLDVLASIARSMEESRRD